MERRDTIEFSQIEMDALKEGIKEYKEEKQPWRKILSRYQFHPRRTSSDLKNKWRNMVLQNKKLLIPRNTGRLIWTSQEVDALKRGFQEFSNVKQPWKLILQKYKTRFNPQRTTVHLKDKWRVIRKNRAHSTLTVLVPA